MRSSQRLPVWTVTVLCIINFNEALQGNIVWPILAYAVQRWGMGGENTGTYVGILASSFFAAQFLFVAAWGHASDRYGRRPTLLLGLVGTCISMSLFGLSRNYTLALAARFLTGALNGNVAISKTYMGEITSSETQARGFAWLAFTWGFGSIVAPAFGALLSEPAENYPELFGHVQFFKDYPYILPSLLSAAFSLTALSLGYFCLPETDVFKSGEHLHKRASVPAEHAPVVEAPAKAPVQAASSPVDDDAQSEHDVQIEDVEVALPERARAASSARRRASVEQATLPHPELARDASNSSNGSARGAAALAALKPIDTKRTVADVGLGTPSKQKPSAKKLDAELAHAATGVDVSAADDDDEEKEDEQQELVQPARSTVPSGERDPELDMPPPRSLFEVTKRPAVVKCVALYAVLSLAQILFDELLPVFCQAPVDHGGLGFPSSQVGSLQVIAGFTQITFQLFILPRILPAFGPLASFRHSMWPLGLLALFPAVSRLTGRPELLWPALAVGVMTKTGFMTVAFTAITVLINNSSRGRGLGLVNGFGQGVASLVRTVGPSVGGAAFSASLSWTSLGSLRMHVVYVIIAAAGVLGAGLTRVLPSWVDTAPVYTAHAKPDAGRAQNGHGDEMNAGSAANVAEDAGLLGAH